MEIVNNLQDQNHDVLIRDLFSQSDTVLMVSPFLFEDFSAWVDKLNLSLLKKIDLVTTLQVFGDDQLRKPKSLLSYIDTFTAKAPAAKISVNFNNSLHGKIYCFFKEEKPIAAIITSANLTNSGISRNHEWGVVVREPDFILQLKAQIEASIEYKNIAREFINNKLAVAASAYKQAKAVDAHLLDLLKRHVLAVGETRAIELDQAHKVFFKPIGTQEEPVLIKDQRSYTDLTILKFPKPRPQDVLPKDIIICFGTGSRCVLSIHTAITHVEEMPEHRRRLGSNDERWPNWLNSVNHTPKFAANWWRYNFTIDELVKEYAARTSTPPITLGHFNQGGGRLNIDKEIARFIIDKVMNIESNI